MPSDDSGIIFARRRRRSGANPTLALNCRANVAGLRKPSSSQISAMCNGVVSRSRLAASNRKALWKSPGGMPVTRRNTRLKWKGLMKPRPAISLSERGTAGRSRITRMTRPTAAR